MSWFYRQDAWLDLLRMLLCFLNIERTPTVFTVIRAGPLPFTLIFSRKRHAPRYFLAVRSSKFRDFQLAAWILPYVFSGRPRACLSLHCFSFVDTISPLFSAIGVVNLLRWFSPNRLDPPVFFGVPCLSITGLSGNCESGCTGRTILTCLSGSALFHVCNG